MKKELLEVAIEILKDEKREIEFIVDHRDILNDTERVFTELHKIRRGIVMAMQHIEDAMMGVDERTFKGIVIPISDYDADCLYDVDKQSTVTITSFFPKTAPFCAGYEKNWIKCMHEDVRECRWRVNGVCKPPKYRVEIVVKYEEVREDEAGNKR